MRQNHSSAPALWVALLLGAGGLLAQAGPGRTADFAPSMPLYQGGTEESEGVKLGGWGSGMGVVDRTYKTSGEVSIKVETDGYYAGARVQYEQPKDITAQTKDPYGFLEFIIRFQPGKPPRQQQEGGFPGGGGFPGSGGKGSGGGGRGSGGGGPRGFPTGAGGPPGGFPGGGFPGAGFPGAGFPGAGGQQTITPDTKKLKVALLCDEGTFVASNFPVTLYPAQDEGWFSIAIPFIAFKGVLRGAPGRTPAEAATSVPIDRAESVHLREIRVFGDNKDTFWIGEIRTTSDDEPISVDSLDELEVSVGEAVEFTAQATGGISPLRYAWDFDLSDGLQEDATGPSVVHVFRKPSRDVVGRPGELQPYVVTLIVRDVSGAKKPVRKQANVVVNP